MLKKVPGRLEQGQQERGKGGAEYLEPGLVRGSEILVKRPVMGATVKRIGGP